MTKQEFIQAITQHEGLAWCPVCCEWVPEDIRRKHIVACIRQVQLARQRSLYDGGKTLTPQQRGHLPTKPGGVSLRRRKGDNE